MRSRIEDDRVPKLDLEAQYPMHRLIDVQPGSLDIYVQCWEPGELTRVDKEILKAIREIKRTAQNIIGIVVDFNFRIAGSTVHSMV